MSRERIEWLKPFLSVVIVIFTLFTIVFFKMEVRRMGYMVWKKSQTLQKAKEDHQRLEVKVVKRMRPDLIHKLAQDQMDLKAVSQAVNMGQIIQMSQDRIALRMNP